MPFSWQHQYLKIPKKLTQRYNSLITGNPEWVVKHPNLAKEFLNKSITNKIEMKKFVDEQVLLRTKYGKVPKPSVIIKRYNRVV